MAKGSRGGRRGGATGGLNPKDIVSTRSLISERERQQEMVDETLSSFKDVFNEYGINVEDIQLAKLKGKGNTAIAYYDSAGNIAVNEAYFNKKGIESAYKSCVDSGFHPSNGNKTAMEAVMYHELGHALTDAVSVKMGNNKWTDFDKTATQIVKEARKQTKHKGVVQMASKISGYAKQSNAEAIAEAFSDVKCNGKKAKSESKAIVNVINKYLKN